MHSHQFYSIHDFLFRRKGWFCPGFGWSVPHIHRGLAYLSQLDSTQYVGLHKLSGASIVLEFVIPMKQRIAFPSLSFSTLPAGSSRLITMKRPITSIIPIRQFLLLINGILCSWLCMHVHLLSCSLRWYIKGVTQNQKNVNYIIDEF